LLGQPVIKSAMVEDLIMASMTSWTAKQTPFRSLNHAIMTNHKRFAYVRTVGVVDATMRKFRQEVAFAASGAPRW